MYVCMNVCVSKRVYVCGGTQDNAEDVDQSGSSFLVVAGDVRLVESLDFLVSRVHGEGELTQCMAERGLVQNVCIMLQELATRT